MSRTSKHTPDIKSSEGVYMDVRENDESCDLQVSEVNAAYIPFEESVVTPRGLDDRKRTSRIHQYEEVETDGLNVTILPENPNKQQERVKNHQYEEIELEDGQVTFIDSSIVARCDSDHPGGESKNLLKHLTVANENVSEDQSGCFCRTKPRSENGELNEHPRIKSAIEQEFSYTEKAGIMKRPQRHSYYNVECVFEGHVDQGGYRSFTSAVKFNDSSEMESRPSELICRDDQAEHARGAELLEKMFQILLATKTFPPITLTYHMMTTVQGAFLVHKVTVSIEKVISGIMKHTARQSMIVLLSRFCQQVQAMRTMMIEKQCLQIVLKYLHPELA